MNTNIRKRRAYGHDDAPAAPIFYGLTLPPSGLGTVFSPVDYRYIQDAGSLPYVVPQSASLNLSSPENPQFVLQQPAWLLNPTVDDLPDPGPQQYAYPSSQQFQSPLDPEGQRHYHKKLRLDTSSQMRTPYSEPTGQEKAYVGGDPDDAGLNTGRGPHGLSSGGGLSSGWTGSRLADCFASFSMCSPFEPQPCMAPVLSCLSAASLGRTLIASPAHTPLLTPTSYGYDDHRPPMLETAVVSVQPQAKAPLLLPPATPDLSALFSCDDPSLVDQYMPNFPPLQPERVMSFQSDATGEGMIYPNLANAANCEGDSGNLDVFSNLGLQPPPTYLVEVSVQAGAVPGTYTVEGEASPYDSQGMVMKLPPHLHPVQGYEIRSGMGDAMAQNESAALGHSPTHKTTVRRGPFKDQDSREKTALTRKLGSCIRCRMQRIRCNFDPENERGSCLSCRKLASGTKVYRLSCLRLKITDVKLFKPGQVKGQEWTNRWKDSVMDDISNWESSQIRKIRVTEGYTGQSVTLRVRQFRPQEGDKVKRSWVSKNGRKHEVEIPAFAIVNLDDAEADFNQYIKNGVSDCCKHLLRSRDELLWRTYSLAIKAAKDPSTATSEKKLLVSTLDLWMSVRLTTKSFEIVGEDTLGMPQDIINDQDNPLHGKIPLPPVMGAQIDSVLIHQIQPQLRRKALEELQKMTQEKKQKTWLTTYLVTFILLHNIALITKHDADYARKHGMPTRFAREANVKEYNLGANTLLAYFHYCNKAIYPFSAECKDQDLKSLAELDDEAISFVHYTRRLIAEHKKEWEEVWTRDEYEHEFYYVSQLYEPNWQPRTMA